MDLHEWTVLYVKHKDAFAKKLRSIDEDGDIITFTFDDGILTAYVMDQVTPPAGEGRMLIVTPNTPENVDALLSHWKEFTRHGELTIVFAEPDRNQKWVVKPALHERITDGNIEQGIRSLATSL